MEGTEISHQNVSFGLNSDDGGVKRTLQVAQRIFYFIILNVLSLALVGFLERPLGGHPPIGGTGVVRCGTGD